MTSNNIWVNSYEKGVSPQLKYPEKNLSEMLHDSTEKYADRVAMVYLGVEWTYAELNRLVSQMANFLIVSGIRPGDRVGIQLLNSPQFVIAYYGALRAGAMTVAINPQFTGNDLVYIIKNSGAKVIITGLENIRYYETIDRNDVKIVVTDIKQPFAEHNDFEAPAFATKLEEVLDHCSGKDPKIPITPDSLANLQYTGGTTGVYKGAMLTHRNMFVNVFQFRNWLTNIYEDAKGVFVCVIPLFHIYGMTTTMNLSIYSGSSILLMSKFDINELMRQIDSYKPNLFMGVPAMYNAIIARDNSKYDLSSIEACVSGSAPISVAICEKFEAITGGKLREGYGLSECSPIVTVTPINGVHKFGSAGTPLPDTEIKIFDPQNNQEITTPGVVGEILVKGPQVMQGYWEMPAETALVLKDGWLHTGDLGSLDEDGYLFIADRLKDMIIMGGEKIYPREIEDLLYAHPAVKEVAAIGVPHQLRGEVPYAYVVLKENATVTEKELRQYCQDNLSKYKVPHKIEFLDKLPRNSVGKLLRRLLREE